MAHINPVVMYDTLNRLQMRLYDIYVLCQNQEIAEAILSERNFIVEVMQQLEILVRGLG